MSSRIPTPESEFENAGIPDPGDSSPEIDATGDSAYGIMTPRDRPIAAEDFGTTAGEEAGGESLTGRLSRRSLTFSPMKASAAHPPATISTPRFMHRSRSASWSRTTKAHMRTRPPRRSPPNTAPKAARPLKKLPCMSFRQRASLACGCATRTSPLPGSAGRKRGRAFRYLNSDGTPVTDELTLARIDALVLPPAWTDVWICPYESGHIQAVGTDAAGRRQYRYHDDWRRKRDLEKFDRILDFAEMRPHCASGWRPI